MKCTACGENNVPTARFCAFCGVKLSGEAVSPAPTAPSVETAGADTAPSANDSVSHSSRATAHPLNDNPYQPYRPSSFSYIPVMPVSDSYSSHRYTDVPSPAETPAAESRTEMPEAVETGAEHTDDDAARVQMPHRAPVLRSDAKKDGKKPEETPAQEAESENGQNPRVRIPSAPKRVFVFADEDEEDILPRSKALRNGFVDDDDDEDEYIDEYDGIREFDDNNEFEEDEDDYDEEDEEDEEPSAGRIFVRIFSVLTVLLLIAGLVGFAYGTTIGRRLRASMGFSSEAADYLLLADWQLAQKNLSDASESYYNAFKLRQDDYDLAMIVGTGFENAGDDARAESLYTYLILHHPQQDEPYDRLMALLNSQGRTAEYESLLDYRAAQQPDYRPPVSQISQILQIPTASHSSGAYAAPLTLTLNAGGAEIRYTIDGTAPTAQSLLYTGSIVLGRGSYTVRAVAVVNGIISGEWTGEFFIS